MVEHLSSMTNIKGKQFQDKRMDTSVSYRKAHRDIHGSHLVWKGVQHGQEERFVSKNNGRIIKTLALSVACYLLNNTACKFTLQHILWTTDYVDGLVARRKVVTKLP